MFIPLHLYNRSKRLFSGGFGLGLMYVPAVVAVGYWFEKRRSLVTGTEDYACAVLLVSCWKISDHRYRR
jgi:hypothetical protein